MPKDEQPLSFKSDKALAEKIAQSWQIAEVLELNKR